MANSDLYGSYFTLSDDIKNHLKTVYDKYKVNRVGSLINSNKISYSNLKKFKSDIENGDANTKQSLGGQRFLNWINTQLNSKRNSINISKKTKTDAGFENQYRKDHDVDYTRASKLDTRSNRLYEEIKLIIESTNKMIVENADLKYKLTNEEDYYTITAYDNNQKVGAINFEEMISGYFYFEDEMTEDEYYELFPDDRFVIISHLTVDKNRRGEGIAQELIQKALTKIKSLKHNRIYLNASPMGGDGLNVNELAKLYKKFGFEELLNQGNNIQMILKLN